MKSTMKHQFSQVPKAEIQRSSFDRSHGLKTTFDSGYLIPILVDEALPGDTFNLKMTAFSRLATPIFPIMDNMFMDTFFFAVPYRLVWRNWEKFNGAQENPGDTTDYLIPQMITAAGYAEGSISDYMGLPTQIANITNSVLWHRAYNLIWNEWFRDENLQDSVAISDGNGPDPVSDYNLMKRGKRHDYFTSSLPFAQKGTAVSIPLGDKAPLATDALFDLGVTQVTIKMTEDDDYHTLDPNNAGSLNALVYGAGLAQQSGEMYADLTQATAVEINTIRTGFQIQRLLERDARGGTRYTESILAHFGVSSPDSRLQRPEYLGGGSAPINITPIAQTQATTAGVTPQANLSATGTVTLHNHGFTKSFTEHCLILGLVSVRADLTYQQGLHRMWSRQERFDFYWPALAHLGEQAVLQQEIYADGIPANDQSVWGYQEIFAEYRYKQSQLTGLMRSNAAQSLDSWHLAQNFSTPPFLGDFFIQDNPPVKRVIAVQTEPDFIFDAYFNMRCARPMPLYGVPGLIDHF